jgi:hypothetical protein
LIGRKFGTSKMPSQNGGTRHEETKERGGAEYAESKGDPKASSGRI